MSAMRCAGLSGFACLAAVDLVEAENKSPAATSAERLGEIWDSSPLQNCSGVTNHRRRLPCRALT